MTGPVAMILAGGAARRMGGGDKGLLPLAGGTVLRHIVDRLSPQVADLALNANGDAARFAALGLPVIADGIAGPPGPLAGVLAAMDWAAARGADAVITVPGDTPFLPGDLVPQLMLAAGPAGLAVVQSGDALHPLCALWPTALAPDLRRAVAAGTRKVRDFVLPLDPGIARFAPTTPDAFFNVNMPEDLAQAERWLTGGARA